MILEGRDLLRIWAILLPLTLLIAGAAEGGSWLSESLSDDDLILPSAPPVELIEAIYETPYDGAPEAEHTLDSYWIVNGRPVRVLVHVENFPEVCVTAPPGAPACVRCDPSGDCPEVTYE